MAAALLLAGKVIQVDITGTQRDQRVFSDPEVFRPERHLEGPAPGIGAIPFGIGPRVCLGKPLADARHPAPRNRLQTPPPDPGQP